MTDLPTDPTSSQVTNVVPRRYRSVSVASVAVPLTESSLRRHFLGLEAYRRTEFIVVRRGDEAALVRVGKASPNGSAEGAPEAGPLFAPIVSLDLLAGPDECAFVVDPTVDTAVPTQMARAAERAAAAMPGARCVVVRGRYEHVSFILDPAPVEVTVVEVVPPWPAKLVDQLERVLETAEDLPAVVLRPHLVDLADLVGNRPTGRWLFPCRGSGAAPAGAGTAEVAYLDERPPRADWVLVGCARSREIHRWFYGDVPPAVELCPRLLAGEVDRPTIVKCCLGETGVTREGMLVTVPWGASLDEIREGLRTVLEGALPIRSGGTRGPEWAPG